MGLSIRNIVESKEITFEDLKGKILAIDTYNFLYQFITTIRTADGSPLRDSKGNITSHLQGIFLRTAKLISEGIKPVFVFDGEAAALKQKERDRRAKLKMDAQRMYDKAKVEEDLENMKKYGGRTARLTTEMVNEAKALVSELGCPVVQAPSEGEALASQMVKNGDVYATVSQDFDALLFGSEKVVRNLSLLGRRKKTNVLGYQTIKPEIIQLHDLLNNLGIDQEMLIVMAILIGTDYNIGGIKGIGPKNAIKKVKECNKEYDQLFIDLKWSEFFDYDWKEVFYTIKQIKTTNDYDLTFSPVNVEGVKKILCDNHDFTEDYVDRSLKKVVVSKDAQSQKSLFDF